MTCRRPGLSLIEVLVASLILAVGLLAVFATLGTGHRDTERIEDEIEATNLAQNAIDFLAALPLGQLPALTRDGKELADLPISSLPGEMTDRATPESVALVRQKIASLAIPQDLEMLVSHQPVPPAPRSPRGPAGRFGEVRRIVVRVRWVVTLAPGRQVARQVVLATLVSDDRAVEM